MSGGLRGALRARPKNGERVYVEEDDFVSGWGAAMDFIIAALASEADTRETDAWRWVATEHGCMHPDEHAATYKPDATR